MAAALPFLPAAAGIAGSLIKGKKTKFATQQPPHQLGWAQQGANRAIQGMGSNDPNKQSIYEAMNMIARMFGGGMGQYGQQTGQQTGPTPNPMIANIFRQQPGQRV